MKTIRGSHWVAFATATSILAFAAPATAQEASKKQAREKVQDDPNVIIVTAQKREQDLQDVPISITAFAGEQLEANRLEGVEDIGRLTPGLYVTPNPADNNGVRINIRGVGTFDPQIGQDSRVAIYKDGVYLGKTQGLAFDLPDLERVEVLKGPQGTLYGRNSVAGAVNLISKRPDGEWGGNVSGEYGRFNHYKLSAAVNIPVSETGGLRLSGLIKGQDGWVENNGPGVDFGGGKQQAFRAAFGAGVTDDLRFDLSIDYSNSEQEPLYYQSIDGFSNPGALFAAAIPGVTGRQNETTTSFENERGRNEQYGASVSMEWDFSTDHSLKVLGAYRTVDSNRFVTLVPDANPFIISGILNADIIPDTQVPGVQSFNNLLAGTALAFQLTGQPLRADFTTPFTQGVNPQTGLFLSPPGGGKVLDGHEQFSLEATLTGEFSDGFVEYTLGAYYYDEFTSTDFNGSGNPFDANSYLFVLSGFNPAINTPVINGALTAQGLAPLQNILPPAQFQAIVNAQLGPIVGDVNGMFDPTTLVGLYGEARQSAANDLRIDSKALALYGEATLNFSDSFSATLGLRYSDESKDGYGQAKSPFFLDSTDLLGRAIDPNIGSIGFSVLNPSLVLQYEPNEDFLVYASYKESFRSGGFNSGAVGPRLQGETFGADFQFGRENIAAYEVGLKSFIGETVRLNAAGFYYDFTDQQTTVALNPLIATSRAIVNTDETIWGFEVDAVAFVTDGFSLNASYSYIDGNAGDVTNPLTGTIEVRDELQGTPKNSFRLGFNFDQAISDSVDFFSSANYSYKDDVLTVPQNALRLSNQNIVSGRFGFSWEASGGSEFSLSIWGENILDDKYQIDSLPFETFALRTEVYGQPASYGITLGAKF